ncbi:unnamed protein product [Fusarium graminearum]|nr:unnamed protein product [Fusarium graminearum]CAG1966303.1 unnamed protein product [Fusarium graminearum]VTO85289.1 unnamed protein product [Fusarium graminearum]
MHAMRQIWIPEVPMLVPFDKHFLEASSTVALGRGRDCMENRMRRSGASLPPSGGFIEQPDSHQYPAREKNHSVPIAVDAWLTVRTVPEGYKRIQGPAS